MDPALLRQRQEFMKSAIKSMGVGTQKAQQQPSGSSSAVDERRKRPAKQRRPGGGETDATRQQLAEIDAKRKAETIQNAANFSMQAKVVDYMKKRHLNQQQWPLSLKDCLEEMQLFDSVPRKTVLWLQESLPDNRRIQTEEDGKFMYRPPHRVKNRATLLALLKKYHADGKGAVILSELNDCVPNAEQLVKSLGDQVIDIKLNKGKEHAYFYNDPDSSVQVDEEFVNLWRLASVDHLDENKIDEYLAKHGINMAKDLAPKRVVTVGVPKRKERRKVNIKVHNVHLENVLEDYKMD